MQGAAIPQASSPLAAWLYYLEHLHFQAIELGLDRIKAVASKMDLLTPAPQVFTVAGTNGKGTTCRTIETILLAAGARVGVYSSPHLIRYTERVRVQGQELNEAEQCASFALIEAGRGDISLTYFEYGTLCALQVFKQAQLDVVILEVGLGGRLDATNIVDANVAVVTSIGLDHTNWLGTDRESIGREKAGIFRTARPAVVGEIDMPNAIRLVAKEKAAELHAVGSAWNYRVDSDSWCWYTGHAASEPRRVVYDDLPLPQVPLANAATALAALHYSRLDVSVGAIKQGLQQAALPGRFQWVSRSPRLILDVAHNPHAANYLAGQLAKLPRQEGKVRAVIGMLADKDIAGTLQCLQPQVDFWYCATLDEPRGAAADQLTKHLAQAFTFDNVVAAWKQAVQDADPQDIVIVCGSFHSVARVMAALDTGNSSGK